LLLLSGLITPFHVASADPWAARGNARLRHDLQLLSDAGIVKVPLTNWPASWGGVSRDISAGSEAAAALPAHLAAAMLRVRSAASEATRTGDWRGEGRIAGSKDAMVLTQFSKVPREDDELEGAVHYTGDIFAMRVTWKPHDRLEIGLSRTAQLCGDGRPCGWSTWWDMLHGNDRLQPIDQQPGNQMGGYEARWSVPWVPLALYSQYIGEDQGGGFPRKFLGLAGAET
jgi:hypothetical protein